MTEHPPTQHGSDNRDILLSASASKDARHRLRLYADWLAAHAHHWLTPDLAAYRNWLLTTYAGRDARPLSPSSVSAHLATIRGRYTSILHDNRTRDLLYEMTPATASPSDRKALVDEALARLANAIAPQGSQVRIVVKQDVADSDHLRLTAAQANLLMTSPGVTTLMGLRDTAIIALMLCTGIREAELVALDVRDVHESLGGELALRVRAGKGAKERLIPYGNLQWVLAILQAWLDSSGIDNGAVFRGFYKGGKRVRPSRIHVRAINQIMERYPIAVNGVLRIVRPHDLRRTYARRLYDAGMDLMAIKANLGHSSVRTTEKYIGTLGVSKRQPPSVYVFDLATLRKPLV